VVNDLKDRERDYVTQKELIFAHKKCGALMHGANPFGKPIDYPFYQKNYPVWSAKIINLLNIHKVHLVDIRAFWLFHMQEDGKGNEVSWYRFDEFVR